MKFPLALFFAASLCAQSPEDAKLFHASQISLASSTAFDLWSSRGLVEENPLAGNGRFGQRQIIEGIAVTAVLIVVEDLMTRKHPKSRRWLTWLNLGYSEGHVIAAAHNEVVR